MYGAEEGYMLESTVNTDLLSVMAKTYLNFTQVVAENGRFSQHFFMVKIFLPTSPLPM